jgi:hypothetical protein
MSFSERFMVVWESLWHECATGSHDGAAFI